MIERAMLNQNFEALAAMATERVNGGWQALLLTPTFAPIPGKPAAVIGNMADAADRLYRTFLTNIVRRPASPKAVGQLPIMIGAPDLPVPKRSRPMGRAVQFNNGGVHFHALLLVPPLSRLREPVAEHFASSERLYVRHPLLALDVRPIDRTPERVLDYVLKSVRRGRFDFDDVLILPRALSELRS